MPEAAGMMAMMRRILQLLLFCGLVCCSQAFLPVTRLQSAVHSSFRIYATKQKQEIATTELRTYSYENYTIRYRYKPPAPGHEQDAPLLLIHPVEFHGRMVRGPAYAPDLLGCGAEDVSEFITASSLPDRWVDACEAVLSLLESKAKKQSRRFPWLPKEEKDSNRWIVVAQGGLAPIGVRIANENPSRVSHLILTSPPTWSDVTNAVHSKELQRNYHFLSSPIWGSLAFQLLETRWAVSFFSNLFLFASKDTTTWLDQVQAGIGPRFPVMVFNAGFCQQVSYETELRELRQPTLILQGHDNTSRNRDGYIQNMKDCRIVTIPGKNVLPWESPTSVFETIREFVS